MSKAKMKTKYQVMLGKAQRSLRRIKPVKPK